MQIFIDSADPREIELAWRWGVIDGVTTNPSLAARVGRPYGEIVQEIIHMVDGPVSLEVIAEDYDGMMEQAHKLHSLHHNVVVKIPCTQTGIQVISELSSQNIKTSCTLVFSPAQALLAGKAGATYCSPFIGRLDDLATDSGEELIMDIVAIYDNFDFDTQILAASVRDKDHLQEVAEVGVDAVTAPFSVIESLVKHPLTDRGLEKFQADWREAGLDFPA